MDCNILPVQDLLGEKLSPVVRQFVTAVLRSELGDELRDVNDDRLLSSLQERLYFFPKSTLVIERLRQMVFGGELSDAFLVGGAQVSDPALSLFHAGLRRIHGLRVHALDTDLVRSARRVMYLEERPGTEVTVTPEQRKAEELFILLEKLLPAIEAAPRPVILLSSTSLCQAHHTNRGTLIPERFTAHLAAALKRDAEDVRQYVMRFNVIPVLSTTTIHAEEAAHILGSL